MPITFKPENRIYFNELHIKAGIETYEKLIAEMKKVLSGEPGAPVEFIINDCHKTLTGEVIDSRSYKLSFETMVDTSGGNNINVENIRYSIPGSLASPGRVGFKTDSDIYEKDA